MKLKNKYGFTLIELLAVIVVLAIIALIATPIVMNTIKKAKQGAAERSADSYVKQVETAVAEERLSKNEVLEGEYQITSDGNLCRDKSASCSDDNKIKIEMSGTKPTSGKIKITNGSVDQTSSSMTIGDYIVSYDKDNNKQQAQELYKGILCKAVTAATDGNVPQGKFAYGDEYICELGDNDTKTFYVLETKGDNVSLIMNANVDSNGKAIIPSNIPTDKGLIAWVTKEDYLSAGGTEANFGSYGKNDLGPITAAKALKEKTKGWTKLDSTQITLPTCRQVAIAGGDTTWNENSNSFGSHLSEWLYNNLNDSKSKVADVYGYWTSTVSMSSSNSAWHVSTFGYLSNIYGITYIGCGVRPVITISKSNLS